MTRKIALLGALDTKGADIGFVRQRIEQRGCQAVVIDIGTLGEPSIQAEIGRASVAEAAGTTLAELIARHDRGHAADMMALGAAAHLKRLVAEKRVDAVLGMGGGTGTAIATAAMRALPFGLPKIMVSTVAASSNAQSYVGTSDIVMMPSVVDVAGLNRISRSVYARAADAVCGMATGADAPVPTAVGSRGLIAATMFGVTTPCVARAQKRLEEAGYEVLVFHANGGGRAMEQLVADGFVDGVLDLTTTEWADELVGGIRSAGPHRLESAAARGTPQVVSVGALEMVNFGPFETVPARFAGRRFHRHNPMTTLMRATVEESVALGRVLAGKLNAATGPVVLLLPLRGMSALDAAGQPFDDPEARGALYATLRTSIDPRKVMLIEVDLHLNDPGFADLAVDTLLGLLKPAP